MEEDEDGWLDEEEGDRQRDGGLGSAGQDPAAKIRRKWRARIGREDPMAKIGRPKLLQEAIGVGSRLLCRQPVWPELAGLVGEGEGWPGRFGAGSAGWRRLGCVVVRNC